MLAAIIVYVIVGTKSYLSFSCLEINTLCGILGS